MTWQAATSCTKPPTGLAHAACRLPSANGTLPSPDIIAACVIPMWLACAPRPARHILTAAPCHTY